MGDVNWLVVVTAAILIVAALLGYINGLIKTILNLVLGVVTLILVLVVSPHVCTYLQEETSLPTYINEKVETVVWEQIEQMRADQSEVVLDQEGTVELVESLPFLPALKDAVLKNEQVDEYANQGIERFADFVSSTVSEKIVILIAYVATFVIVFFALRILAFLLNIAEHLPLIHGLNKMAGLAFGLAEGLLAVWILGMILSAVGTTGLGQSAAQCISESKFLSILYGHNLLQYIIFWTIA